MVIDSGTKAVFRQDIDEKEEKEELWLLVAHR